MDVPGAVSMPRDDRAPGWEAQAWALSAEADRRRRRQGTALIIVSAVFVLISVFCLFIGALVLIGLVGLMFFGGCLLAGILMRGDPDSQTTLVLSLLLGLGCALLFTFTLLSALRFGLFGAQLATLAVSAIGFVLFGIGGVVALVWRRRQRRARLQYERAPRRTERS